MQRNDIRLKRVFTYELQAPPKQIFPLLCPVREYEWIERWQCEVIYSLSGLVEPGCVFRTDFPGDGPEVWVTCRHEPPERIEFVRIGEHLTTHYVITLQHQGHDRTLITWAQELTALSAEGKVRLGALTEDVYAQKMNLLNTLLDHFLTTGQCKPMTTREEA